jgi:stage V sporulation protein SpoVS
MDLAGVERLVFSTDGKYAAYVRRMSVHVIELMSGREMTTIPVGMVDQLAISDDGAFLAWVGKLEEETRYQIYDLRSGESILHMDELIASQEDVTFWLDYGILVKRPQDGTAMFLIDVPTGSLLRSFPNWQTNGTKAHFPLHGKFLVVPADYTLLVFDTSTPEGDLEIKLPQEMHYNQGNLVSSLTISPTGLVAVRGEYNIPSGTVITLWNVHNGEKHGELRLPGFFKEMRFSEDGEYLLHKLGCLRVPSSTAGGIREDRRELSISRQWIRQDGKDLLWIPANYNEVNVAVEGNKIVFAYGLDRVEILALDLERTPIEG